MRKHLFTAMKSSSLKERKIYVNIKQKLYTFSTKKLYFHQNIVRMTKKLSKDFKAISKLVMVDLEPLTKCLMVHCFPLVWNNLNICFCIHQNTTLVECGRYSLMHDSIQSFPGSQYKLIELSIFLCVSLTSELITWLFQAFQAFSDHLLPC